MTTLVTGAAGFVGRHVIDALLERGRPVRALVRSPSQADDMRRRGMEVVVGDIRDAEMVRRAVAGVDVVQHCAAAVGPQYSEQEIHEITLQGTRHLVDALRERRAGRLILLSSINVLGNRHLEGESEDLPYRRFGEVRGDVKIEAEQMALEHFREHGVEVVVLRPAMIYGPGDNNLEKLLRPIRRGKFAFIGSRENVIPVVHVDDVVQAMLLAAESPQAAGRVYHIADGSRVTAGELADYLAELTDSPPPRRVLPYSVVRAAVTAFESLGRVGLLKGKPPINRVSLRFLGSSRSIDIGRAREELGYEPRVEFRTGMAAAVRGSESSANDEPNVPTSRG